MCGEIVDQLNDCQLFEKTLLLENRVTLEYYKYNHELHLLVKKTFRFRHEFMKRLQPKLFKF
jgi:hypothetical protein